MKKFISIILAVTMLLCVTVISTFATYIWETYGTYSNYFGDDIYVYGHGTMKYYNTSTKASAAITYGAYNGPGLLTAKLSGSSKITCRNGTIIYGGTESRTTNLGGAVVEDSTASCANPNRFDASCVTNIYWFTTVDDITIWSGEETRYFSYNG